MAIAFRVVSKVTRVSNGRNMSSSTVEKKADTAVTFDGMHFPEIIDGKINTEEFLQAARKVVWTVGTYLSVRYF